MGQMKRVIEDREAALFEAEELAIKVGWMERCEDHHEMHVDDSSQKGRAYARARIEIKNGRTSFTYDELKDALDRLSNNAGATCSGCRFRLLRDN